jgi:hypothetical protein
MANAYTHKTHTHTGVEEYSLTSKSTDGVRPVHPDERVVVSSSTQLVGKTLALSFKRPINPSRNVFQHRHNPNDVRPLVLSAADFVFARGPLANDDDDDDNDFAVAADDGNGDSRVEDADARDRAPPRLAHHVFRRSGAINLKIAELLSANEAVSLTRAKNTHAVFMFMAFGVTLPLGVLAARVLPREGCQGDCRWVQSRSLLPIITCLAFAIKHSLSIRSFVPYFTVPDGCSGIAHCSSSVSSLPSLVLSVCSSVLCDISFALCAIY